MSKLSPEITPQINDSSFDRYTSKCLVPLPSTPRTEGANQVGTGPKFAIAPVHDEAQANALIHAQSRNR